MNFKNIKIKSDVKTNEVEYGDFRDWFILDKKQVHKTDLYLYLNNEKIHNMIFPINTNEINFEIQAQVNTPIRVTEIQWKIPEMGIDKVNLFPNPTMIDPGDTINVNLEVRMYGE